MSDPVPKPWTIEQFFAWQSHQTERYELVSGFPVRMMAGARNVHNDIVINILAELRGRLRIVVVEPNAPEVVVWSRGQQRAWVRHIVEGIDREVDMPAIGVTLSLAEIYDGVAFPARPRWVGPDEPREETAADSADPPPAEPG